MKNKLLFKKVIAFTALIIFGFSDTLSAQNAVKDTDPKNDIMFQTFGWDEYKQARMSSVGGLYSFYSNAEQAKYLNDAGIDMMWFPPASQSMGGTGYIPTKLFNFSKTEWGTEAQLKTMLAEYNNLGMYPIADVVVNHRGGTTGWMDFTEPTWDCTAITKNDEASTDPGNTGIKPCGSNDTGENYGSARDLDHTNAVVRSDVKKFLGLLKDLGFKGWRWDVAKGFAASYFGEYITASTPYYSVGEYWDGGTSTLMSWVDGTGKKSGAFDFANYYKLSGAIKGDSYGQLMSGSRMYGLAGVIGYDDKAVTFVDNHDTFVDANNYVPDDKVVKGYAYILTHPGIPCVWAAHYYGGSYTKENVTRTYTDHQLEINKLMGVRKQNGINAYSSINVVQSGTTYAAYISATYNTPAVVAVRLGSGTWTPEGTGWIENASGTGYKVWSKKAITTPKIPTEQEVKISLIGDGISSWTVDVPMASIDNKNYTLENYSFKGGPVKFRANSDWTLNWGGTGLSGKGVQDGGNITVAVGKYNVSFNRETGIYDFGFLSREDFNKNEDFANIKVYPNPSQSDWNIAADERIISVTVSNILIDSPATVIISGNTAIISGELLPQGMHFATIKTINSVKTIKLIKE